MQGGASAGHTWTKKGAGALALPEVVAGNTEPKLLHTPEAYLEYRSKLWVGLWCRDAAEDEAYERRLARSWADVRAAVAAQVAEEAGAFLGHGQGL